MENIKVAFLGAACTGKSTLINALAGEYPQFKIQTESVRYLKDKYGMDFRSGDTALQLSLLHLQTRYLMEPSDYLLDRSSIDSYAYSLYYKERGQSDIPANAWQYLYDMSKYNARNLIDLIIYLKPNDFPMVPDGVRIFDEVYQKETDQYMERVIKDFGVEDKVIRPRGTVIERVNFCKKYIDQLKEIKQR